MAVQVPYLAGVATALRRAHRPRAAFPSHTRAAVASALAIRGTAPGERVNPHPSVRLRTSRTALVRSRESEPRATVFSELRRAPPSSGIRGCRAPEPMPIETSKKRSDPGGRSTRIRASSCSPYARFVEATRTGGAAGAASPTPRASSGAASSVAKPLRPHAAIKLTDPRPILRTRVTVSLTSRATRVAAPQRKLRHRTPPPRGQVRSGQGAPPRRQTAPSILVASAPPPAVHADRPQSTHS